LLKHHIPEEWNLKEHHCENFRPCDFKFLNVLTLKIEGSITFQISGPTHLVTHHHIPGNFGNTFVRISDLVILGLLYPVRRRNVDPFAC
jgi:hypothetical protein